MKVGDLVQRNDDEGREELGVGIIVNVEEHYWIPSSTRTKDDRSLIVMYPKHGLSWDGEDWLERVG